MNSFRFVVAFGLLLLLLSGNTLVGQPAIEAAPEGVFMGVVGGKGTEGAKALVYYDVELFPGQEFNGYIFFWTEEPNPEAWDAEYTYHWEDSGGWVTMTPLGFRSKGCDEIQRVQFKFTAPNQPGVYKGAVIDNLSNFPAVEIMLIVTEEPSSRLVSSVDTVRARLGDVITQPVGAIWNGLQGSFGCAPVPYFPVETMLVTLKTFPQDANWLRFNPSTLLSPKTELVVGQRIFRAERMGTFEAYEVRESEHFPQPLRRKWVFIVDPPVISDVNRFGRSVNTVLGGVTVTILRGDNAIGSTVTREDGTFEFEFDPFALDPGLEYAVRLEKDDIRRTFGPLHRDKVFRRRTLPVTVLSQLEIQLKRLEETGTLVAGYDLTEVRTLLSDWNNEDPESDELQSERNFALGRLVVAAEALADIYSSTEPLAMETAKVTVNFVTAILSLKKMGDKVKKVLDERQTAAAVSGSVNPDILAGVSKFTYKIYWLLFKEAWSHIADKLETIMPPGPAKLWKAANTTAQKYVLAVVEAEPDKVAGIEGRKAAIQAVVEEASKAVGGRVLASSHVLATQGELDLATNDASKRFGIGTVQSARVASQEVVNAVALRTDHVLDLSTTLGDVTKWWGVVADLSFALGSATGFAGVAKTGEEIKLLNVGLIGFVAASSFGHLFQHTATYTPWAARRAFNPELMRSGLLLAEGATGVPAAKTQASRSEPLLAYLEQLAELRDLVVASDTSGVVELMQGILSASDTLDHRIESTMLDLMAVSEEAAQEREGYLEDLTNTFGTYAGFTADRVRLYASIAAYLAPEIYLVAPEEGESGAGASAGKTRTVPADSVLKYIQFVGESLTAFDQAASHTLSLAEGIVPEGLALIRDHGPIGEEGILGTVSEASPVTLRARVVNAGREPVEGVMVTLAADGDTLGGPTPVLRVTSPRSVSIGTLAPGAARTITWQAVATDTSSTGSSSVASYEIQVSATSGRVRDTSGWFSVEPTSPTSVEWAKPVTGLSLDAPWPNPSRGWVTLRYDVPAPADVRISLVDMLGREALTPVRSFHATGTHTVTVNTADLAPGVYVVRLTSAGRASTRRITVVR